MFKFKKRLSSSLPTKDLRLLVLVRGLRSFAQGFILVIFAIYLHTIGFSSWLIGLTLGIGSAASALLILLTGILSDRFGRKPFLLAYGILLAFSGLIFSITTSPLILIAVSALGGIGRSGGAGGQAGPFAPAETAFISQKTTVSNRSKIFTINTIIGTLATAIGASCAGLPELVKEFLHVSFFVSYQPFFLIISLIGLATFFILLPITEKHTIRRIAEVKQKLKNKNNFNRIWKLSTAGFINGIGMGFVSGILPYWLYLRFHVSPAALGPVIGISMVITAISSFFIVPLARHFGDIIIISITRAIAVVCTLLLAFAPNFPVAALFVIFRTVGAMSAISIRQSFSMGIVDDGVRGTTAGFTGVARRLPAAISPAFSGYWLNMNELELPLFASTLFMGINVVLYYLWFRRIKPADQETIEEAL